MRAGAVTLRKPTDRSPPRTFRSAYYAFKGVDMGRAQVSRGNEVAGCGGQASLGQMLFEKPG